jgi:succinyl-diaminopimelate desuccinylase
VNERIVELAGKLVRTPTVAGEHDCAPALDLVHSRLTSAGVHSEIVEQDGKPIALVARAGRAEERIARSLCLNACIDTAPVGDRASWSFDPFAGDVADSYLRGRGSADSKLAVAMFTELMCAHSAEAMELWMLIDADEHTGGFGGVMAGAELIDATDVVIGYPGLDKVCTGARGLVRLVLHVTGEAMHSGSSRRERSNAAVHAAHLALALDRARHLLDVDQAFGKSGEITVTGIEAGTSFSQVPGSAQVLVDIRTTPLWRGADAVQLVERVIAAEGIDCQIKQLQEWPAYETPQRGALVARMREATDHISPPPVFEVAGPSNIGNWLAGQGFDVLCGFGVRAEGVHGADERANLADLDDVLTAYRRLIASYA